jgi:hypothetical protein
MLTLLASLTALVYSPAAFATDPDISFLMELPTLHTPIARYEAGAENRLPLNFAFRSAFAFPRDRPWHAFFGYTVRGGRTAIDTPIGQFRLDYGWRRDLSEGRQGTPYLELGTGAETIWFADPEDGAAIHGGWGPTVALGLRFPEAEYLGTLGLRLTSAWMSGGYVRELDDVRYRFQPSHLSLAFFVGQIY